MDGIYADNAATTKISHKAMEAMVSSMENTYGNPSSLHQIGMEANDALQTAREQIARCLGCTPKEIYFTSGGTESDNQAIISAAMLGEKQNKKHIISTAFEHHAVLYTLRKLKEQGFEVELLDAGEEGNITAEQVQAAIRPDTCLVTTMFANNEIGLRDMAGQRKHFQTGQRIQNQIGDIPCRVWPHKVHMELCDFFQLPLGGVKNHKISHADRSPPTVFWIPPAYRWVRRKAGLLLRPPALRAASRLLRAVQRLRCS